ncbi:phage tail protein [Pseudomonas fuscovaginae UPB0736]|uniref:hypothetical protein n=1 Tax=Pseudomonas asplenii TaxID=53407 RepID=UPI0002882432|nr:hypothetical protein [Pseudomonas fuscovaginae]UUQ66344.1 phage tail protein [Pseudomonas fuscovaginae UPB0736]
MGIETTITKVVDACNKLTETVTNQLGKIDARMDVALDQFTNWRNSVKAKDINGKESYAQIIDLTGLPTDMMYPVWWRMPGNDRGVSEISITRTFSQDSDRDPFKNNAEVHVAGLNLELEGCGCLWHGDANFMAIKRVSQTYRETVRRAEFGMLCIARPATGTLPMYAGIKSGDLVNSYQDSGCYLRGGLTYKLVKNFSEEVHYSRVDKEVEISRAVVNEVNNTGEIAWMVKSFSINAPEMGQAYPETRLAYTNDNDKRYTVKGA